METLQIKNMVCPRCISTVKSILNKVKITYDEVLLGQIHIPQPLHDAKLQTLKTHLEKEGFALISDKSHQLTSQIKTFIIAQVYQENCKASQNLSVSLQEKFHKEYSQLSLLFSKTEGKSIQDFQKEVKIMRIKELLEYNEKSIAEMADELGYGNAAYLSTVFKKATGLTPSQYKKQSFKNRNTLDEL